MKRTVLAVLSFYIDFLFANTLITAISFLIGTQIGYVSGAGTPWYAEVLASILAAGAVRKLFVSPGEFLLTRWNAEADEGRRLWPNLVLGTFLVLEGLKHIVRWTNFDIVMPVFGLLETSPWKIALLVSMGTLLVITGLQILQFAPRSKLLALGALAFGACSLLVSWPVLDDAIARVQTARRAAQGLPLRVGEIEAMQTIFPTIMAAMLTVLLLLLFFSRERSAKP